MQASLLIESAAPRAPAAVRAKPRTVVVTLATGSEGARGNGHEAATRTELARRLARLHGVEFAGEFDASTRYPAPLYCVPAATLTTSRAAQLGLLNEADLYGGVVPCRYVATKTITHPLLDGARRAPPGWNPLFATRIAHVALRGYAVFSREDAFAATERLLAHGTARLKPAAGIAGLGQSVIACADDLARALDALGTAELEGAGAVVEENLADVVTFSVGQTRFGALVVSYCGTQELTTDNRGREVYGGSRLTFARGDFDALLSTQSHESMRAAIAQARAYDAAADRCYTGFFASRRNYDVAQGRDATGRLRSGVLEQSWRLGGASGAEVAALEAFAAYPALRCVRASTREVYGAAPALPPGAIVCYSGTDPRVGPLTKYAWVEQHAHAR